MEIFEHSNWMLMDVVEKNCQVAAGIHGTVPPTGAQLLGPRNEH